MKLFDIEPGQDIDRARLYRPHRSEVQGEDASPGGNQHYQDLRDFRWTDVASAITVETGLIARIEAAAQPALEEELIVEELCRLEDFSPDRALYGLDVGVGSAVLTVSAAGATPIASCNGGAFGHFHQGANPFVAFYALPRRILPIMRWARQAELRLEINDHGVAVLHARRIADFLTFARSALAEQQ